MNIEDLIRRANPVQASDVPAGDSPPARRALAQILSDHSGGGALRRSRGARPGRRRTLFTVGVAATAAAATAAILVSAVLSEAPRKPPRAVPSTPVTVHPPKGHRTKGGPTTAREVLLTAAAHVLASPTTGKYWRVQEISGFTWPGGTKAHPYDISFENSYDKFNPRSPGQKVYEIDQQLGTRPATPADAAAWRAAGSPTTWPYEQLSPRRKNIATLGGPWGDEEWPAVATTVAQARTATWAVSDGTVGFIEGDLAGLNTAQFAQIPGRPRAVAALLRSYAEQTPCVQHPSSGCSTEDQIVWSEALFLLEDPVSPQVRSATFKVMASLPGVRLLGPMTDPLGRTGYGITGGPQDDTGSPYYHPLNAVVIDPATGSLLATVEIGPIPRSVRCWTILNVVGHMKCLGPPYLGRSYPGQVESFIAVVSAGWTNGSPSLPRSTQEVPTGFPGLPPA